MYRKFENLLLNWKNDGMKKPMMVVGVRQIGKTYSIDKFCKENFHEYIYINLLEHSEIVKMCKSDISVQDKVKKIEWLIGKTLDGEDKIVFFDEIQESEELISYLKYFCESEKKYNIIVAGSLLGVKINRFHASFPVGKIYIEHMYPMDFEEFLIALDKGSIVSQIRECYKNNLKMEEVTHSKLIELYRFYLCVGGMPEAVNDFVERGADIMNFDRNISKLIIEMYIADMNKYIYNVAEGVKIEKVYNNISYQLAKENKKFQYSKIEGGSNKRKYASALDWLLSSNMIYICNNVKTVDIPLKVYQNENIFKVYMSDVGLLASVSELKFSDVLLDNDFRYKGAIVENYVAQTFASNGISLNYWSSENIAEVDFLVTTSDGVIPVEVKSSDNFRSKSLKVYMEKYSPKYAIRLSTRNFGMDNGVKSVPLYAAFCIEEASF